jgi:hypothetical protein
MKNELKNVVLNVIAVVNVNLNANANANGYIA